MPTAISDPASQVTQEITDALEDLDHNQAWLGIRVAEIEGRDDPFSQPAVHGWLKAPENMRPSRLFSIEKALGRRPGSISRLLGYVPADAAPASSVEAAIEADTSLPASSRRFLIDTYRAAQRRGE